jgi:hypothetical protein
MRPVRSSASSSTAGDLGGEELKSLTPSTPTPIWRSHRGGLLRTPLNTTLAVDSKTVIRRKAKPATALIPFEPQRMNDIEIGSSEAYQPARLKQPLRSAISVKDLIKRMSHFRSKISMKLTGVENYT